MSSEHDRVLSLAAEMGVSRVALQSDDLQKLTDSSSDGLDFESDDDDTAPAPAPVSPSSVRNAQTRTHPQHNQYKHAATLTPPAEKGITRQISWQEKVEKQHPARA